MAEEDPLSPGEFTRKFVAALSARETRIEAVIRSDLELALTKPDGSESSAYLDNAYTMYVNEPSALTEIIETYVQSLLAVGDEKLVDSDRIVPVIKDRTWLHEHREALMARGAKQVRDNVVDDLNDELIIVYAEDSPTNIRYLTPEDLAVLPLPRGRLKDIAVENLGRLLPPVEMHTGSDIIIIKAGGDYDASLLLLDEIWSSGQIKVDGEIVVAVPSRDLLMVTGSANAVGLAKMREVATSVVKEVPYRLTDTLFVYRDGRFTTFRPN